MLDAPLPTPTAAAHRAQHRERTMLTFTRPLEPPRPVFALLLVSVTVAVLALHADHVLGCAPLAFAAGVLGSAVLAVVVGRLVWSIRSPRARVAAGLLLPTLGGGLVGVLVQSVVLAGLPDRSVLHAIKDLGGRIDTTHPGRWLLGGLVLGGVPALLVSGFLVAFAYALRRAKSHRAADDSGLGFTGFAGLFAVGWFGIVDPVEMVPLGVVAALAWLAVLVAFLVDGARLELLGHVWESIRTGAPLAETGYAIVPAADFRHDPELASWVSGDGAAQVLLRLGPSRSAYRSAAAEPIAVLGETEHATTEPLRYRRASAIKLLLAIAGMSAMAAVRAFLV